MSHRVVWFDMPVTDLDRASRFYSNVLDAEINEEFPGVAVFKHGPGDVTGCLHQSDSVKPSEQGVLLYFDVSGRMDEAMVAVEQSGGSVQQPWQSIGEFGRRAIVLDSEGNRIALHSE